MKANVAVGWMLVLVGASCVSACGVGTPGEPDYSIRASAAWSWNAAQPDALGYTVTVLLEQETADGRCRKASASTRLTVDGVPVTLSRDPGTDCLTGQFSSPPVLGDLAVTARLEEEGDLVGEVVFAGLMPGTAATLVSPADGRVRAGDEVLIVPPPQLPTSVSSRERFYALDDGAWLSEGIFAKEAPVRDLEGLHLTVPAFTGPAVLIVKDGLAHSAGDVVCPGFARCMETIGVTLGPFMLTGVP